MGTGVKCLFSSLEREVSKALKREGETSWWDWVS